MPARQPKPPRNDYAGRAPGVVGKAETTLRFSAIFVSGVNRAIWLAAYRLEEARQRYAARRQPLRQAAACFGLALLRLVGTV
jgi:hypothetical protein